jgi:ATP-dependent DNA helicase RecG
MVVIIATLYQIFHHPVPCVDFDFRTGEIHILVATTVIEVGVDVPNANLLTIESAERFGLSQLHQLRGRIGRGKHPGYCTVFCNAETEEAQKRLKAFGKLSDGFKLAEKDFEIRGAGDLFGTQQHHFVQDLRHDTLNSQMVLPDHF